MKILLLSCVREQIWLTTAPPQSGPAPELQLFLCMEYKCLCLCWEGPETTLWKKKGLVKIYDCSGSADAWQHLLCYGSHHSEDATTCQDFFPRICLLKALCQEHPQQEVTLWDTKQEVFFKKNEARGPQAAGPRESCGKCNVNYSIS